MSEKQSNLFSQIKKKTNINPTDIFKVANSVQNADFSDETTVRDLVKKLSQMANKPISKEKEDKIVEAIVKNKLPMDSKQINKFL